MGAVIGIDLGTTNTVVGVVQGARASTVANERGERLIPSVVSFPPDGSVLVGREAKDRRPIDPKNTIYSTKRLIGRSFDSEPVQKAKARTAFELREGPGHSPLVVARGESFTLPEISALVLSEAKRVAEATLDETVDRAVITVPANFNDLQRAATKIAGRIAAMEVVRILNEPTAAALAYGYGKGNAERIAVYDFGGGTFDVTLLDLAGNVFEVLATAGDTFLGGDDIDQAIAERIAAKFLATHRYDPKADPAAFEQLVAVAERIKVTVSSLRAPATMEVKDVGYGPGGKPLSCSYTLTPEELAQISAPFVERTLKVCKDAMGIARLKESSFEQVILVGGSTRLPTVREKVGRFFGKTPLDRLNPDEVVALGAAIQAAALTGSERRRPLAAGGAAVRPTNEGPPSSQVRPGSGQTAPGVAPAPKAPDASGAAARLRVATNPGVGSVEGSHSSAPGSSPPRHPPIHGVSAPVSPAARRGTPPRPTPSDDSASDQDEPRTLTAQVAPRRPPPPPPPLMKATAGAQAGNPARPPAAPLKPPRPSAPGQPAAPRPSATTTATFDSASDRWDLPLPLVSAGRPDSDEAEERTEVRGFRAPGAPERRSETKGGLGDETAPTDRIEHEQLWEAAMTAIADGNAGSWEQAQEETTAQHQAPNAKPADVESWDLASEVETTLPSQQAFRPPPRSDAAPETKTGSPAPQRQPASPAAAHHPVDQQPAAQLPLEQPARHQQPVAHQPVPQPAQQPASWHPAAHQPVPQPAQQPAARQPVPQPKPQDGALDLAPAWEQMMAHQPIPSLQPEAAVAHPPAHSSAVSQASLPPVRPMVAAAAIGTPVAAQAAPASAPKPPPKPLLIDVTPLSLSVETVGGWGDVIIERNTPVPCERTRLFATASDNQETVRVNVAQGESLRFGENVLLGQVELTGLRPGVRGDVKIAVTFELDTDGILGVRAVDRSTGQATTAKIRLGGAVPEVAEVEQMAERVRRRTQQ